MKIHRAEHRECSRHAHAARVTVHSRSKSVAY